MCSIHKQKGDDDAVYKNIVFAGDTLTFFEIPLAVELRKTYATRFVPLLPKVLKI